MADRPVNFSAGPAILPAEVLEAAAKGVIALDHGLSVLEISHRSKPFEAILEDALTRLRRILSVPDTHEILFLQGGASGQFAQIPLNFLGSRTAAYVLSGAWSKKALAEAKRVGRAEAVASTQEKNFTELPPMGSFELPTDAAYVHTTSNNTIFGTQWPEIPNFGSTKHACDMSSDILSRRFDVSKLSLVYAGAQKNAGPAGVTIVIIEKQWAESAREDIPSIWRYQTQIDGGSMYNTPPAFGIFCVGLVARWVEEQGGLDAVEARNDAKAALLYEAIDGSDGFYVGTVTKVEHRSRMNVTFRLETEDLEKRFLGVATAAGLDGLKGHRSVGGLRASIYNAMPVAGVERLVDLMQRFRKDPDA